MPFKSQDKTETIDPQRLTPQQHTTKRSAAYLRIPWGLIWTVQNMCSTTAATCYITIHGLAERYPYTTDYLATRMSREMLADCCGVSMSTLDRVLAELETQDLITRYRTRHPYIPHRQGWSIIHVRIPEAAWAKMAQDDYVSRAKQTSTEEQTAPSASTNESVVTPTTESVETSTAPEGPPNVGQGRSARSSAETENQTSIPDASSITPKDIQRYWAKSNASREYVSLDLDSIRLVCETVASALADGVPESTSDLIQCIGRALLTLRNHLPSWFQVDSIAVALGRSIRPEPSGHNGHTITQVVGSIDADTMRLLRVQLSPVNATNDEGTRQKIERRVFEAAWALAHGFAQSSQSKAINAVKKLIRNGRWSTPYGFDSQYILPTSDGGLQFTA